MNEIDDDLARLRSLKDTLANLESGAVKMKAGDFASLTDITEETIASLRNEIEDVKHQIRAQGGEVPPD